MSPDGTSRSRRMTAGSRRGDRYHAASRMARISASLATARGLPATPGCRNTFAAHSASCARDSPASCNELGAPVSLSQALELTREIILCPGREHADGGGETLQLRSEPGLVEAQHRRKHDRVRDAMLQSRGTAEHLADHVLESRTAALQRQRGQGRSGRQQPWPAARPLRRRADSCRGQLRAAPPIGARAPSRPGCASSSTVPRRRGPGRKTRSTRAAPAGSAAGWPDQRTRSWARSALPG